MFLVYLPYVPILENGSLIEEQTYELKRLIWIFISFMEGKEVSYVQNCSLMRRKRRVKTQAYDLRK